MIIKNKIWQIGIAILVIGTILSVVCPSIFTNVKLIAGIILILVGIISIYQVCTEKPNY